MKKPLNIVFSVLIATLFFFAGTGYNLITYCCSTCEHSNVDKIASCCSDCKSKSEKRDECGMSHDENAQKDVCANMEHHKKSCELKRLTLEIPTLQDFKFNFNNTNFLVLSYFIITNKIDIQENITSSYFFNPPNFCSLSSGREILANNSILLI